MVGKWLVGDCSKYISCFFPKIIYQLSKIKYWICIFQKQQFTNYKFLKLINLQLLKLDQIFFVNPKIQKLKQLSSRMSNFQNEIDSLESKKRWRPSRVCSHRSTIWREDSISFSRNEFDSNHEPHFEIIDLFILILNWFINISLVLNLGVLTCGVLGFNSNTLSN